MNLAGPSLQEHGRPCGPDRCIEQAELASLDDSAKALVASAYLRLLAAEMPAPHEAFEEALELVSNGGAEAHRQQLVAVFEAARLRRGEMLARDPAGYRAFVARRWPSQVAGPDLEVDASGAPALEPAPVS